MSKQEDTLRERLSDLAAAHDVAVSEVSHGHFHLRGAVLVNYWPFSRKSAAHVANAKNGHPHCTVRDAVLLAKNGVL